MSVDPEFALRDIDETKYPEFPKSYAITQLGLQLHLAQDLADQEAHQQVVNTMQGTIDGYAERLKASVQDAAHNAWWARWAPAIILSVSTAAAIAGGILGFGLDRVLHP